MANCRSCGEVIFFAWHRDWQRWLPCELESIRDNDVEHEGGLVWEKHHQRHRCGFKARREAWRSSADEIVRDSGPHATLFVTPDAPIEVIRAAYRALAALYHPDVGGDQERMLALNAAYEELVGKNGSE